MLEEQILLKYREYTAFLSKLQSFYTHYLYRTPEVLNYVHSRGITDDYITFCGLGYNPGIHKLLEFVRLNHLQEEYLLTLKILLEGDNSHFDPLSYRFIFSLFDILGNIVGFSGRTCTREQEVLYAAKTIPKYINTSSSDIFAKSLLLYNLHNAIPYIQQEGYVIVVEGMMDVITLFMYGIRNVVAPCGTSFTKEHCFLLRYLTERVVVLYDNDEPGIKASKRVIENLTFSGLQAFQASIPKGDPDSFIREHGKDILLQHILTSFSLKLSK